MYSVYASYVHCPCDAALEGACDARHIVVDAL
jgi:hypothetical protein